MRRGKQIIAIAVVLLLLSGDYLYWTVELPLQKALPREVQETKQVQLYYYDDFFTSTEITVDEDTLRTILEAVEETEVTRRPRFSRISQSFFHLFLHYPNGYTTLTIVEDGNISAYPKMDSDRRIYFDGGEELYECLHDVIQDLS